MKKIAKFLALAISSFAIYFSSCSNSVEVSAVTDNASKVKTLDVYATSNDEIVTFGQSRTITPDALNSEDLTFYLWGLDTINAVSVPVKPVVFSAADTLGVVGNVPVELNVSNYKLYLAAVDSTVASSLVIAGDEASYETDYKKVLEKAVLYANSNVDLRFNQTVKFYLSPSYLSGNSGDITLTLMTKDFTEADDGTKDYWHDYRYHVLISLRKLTDNSVVAVTPAVIDAAANVAAVPITSSGDYLNNVWVQYPVVTNKSDPSDGAPGPITGWGALETSDGLVYKLTAVPSGTYNLVVDFTDGTKHFYYSEKILMLTNQEITETVEIPNVIAKKPAPVSNFQVGYNDPDSADNGYYLATFQWDDNSNNEEYFVLQLVDVSNDTVASDPDDGTTLGLSTDAVAALAAVSADTNTSITPATYATDFAAVKAAWDAEVTSAKLTAKKISAMSLDKTVYQKTESLYAAGSLDKNSTSISLWLPLGSVYMARICAYNDACSSLGANEAAILNSDQEWLYSNKAALTTDDGSANDQDELSIVYLSTGTNGYLTDAKTPKKWPKVAATPTAETNDTPVAINRYRLTYFLNNGKFWKVQANGKLTSVDNNQKDKDNVPNPLETPFGATDTNVTGSITGIDSYKDKIVEYHTATAIGTEIISPIRYKYDSTNYTTLFNGDKVWTCWKKGHVNGDEVSTGNTVYRQIDWQDVLETGDDLTDKVAGDTVVKYDIDTTTYAAASVTSDPSYYVNSNYGYVLSSGFDANSVPALAASPTYDDVKKISSTGSIRIRSTLANYMTFDNLKLFANYNATTADVTIVSPDNYDLGTQNIRITKCDTLNGTYISANVQGPISNPVTGTYEDFEIDGNSFIISKFNRYVKFACVEDTATPIYKKITLEITKTSGGSDYSETKTADNTKFTVDNAQKNLAGSGDGAKEPLTLGDYSQYVFNVDLEKFLLDKYTARFYAYTDLNETAPFTYNVYFELTDPQYQDYEVATSDKGTELYEKNGTKYYRSEYTSYAAATAAGVTVYYGKNAKY